MQHVVVWLAFAFAFASPTLAEPDAAQLLDEVRIALAGGRDIVPDRIEIEAVYHYADDDRVIRDRTVIEPGLRLFQEREIGGRTIRRAWNKDEAYLEGPEGRMPLDQSMRDDLETYLCRRQLEVLVLCPGAEATLLQSADADRQTIAIRRGGELLAEIEVDVENRRLLATRYPETGMVAGLDEDPSTVLVEARFSEYREVDGGWILPHKVETALDGEPSSSFDIDRWVVGGP